MWLIRFDRASRRRGPGNPRLCPIRRLAAPTTSICLAPRSSVHRAGGSRQAGCDRRPCLSPETAVHGGFAYASRLRSTPSRALNTALISNASTKGQVARYLPARVLTFSAHHRLPSKTALSGATGQGRPVEARQGRLSQPTRPTTQTRRGHPRSGQAVLSKARVEGRAIGPPIAVRYGIREMRGVYGNSLHRTPRGWIKMPVRLN